MSRVVNLAISAGWKLNGPRSNEMRSSPDATPDQEQQRQDHEGEAVEEPRPILPPLVVDRHHDEHHDGGPDREDHLAGDERVRVVVDAGP